MTGKTLHWCRRYFTKNFENGKFKCNFCGEEYVENATRQGNHIEASVCIVSEIIGIFRTCARKLDRNLEKKLIN